MAVIRAQGDWRGRKLNLPMWGKGQFAASPRDNVIFECGLFMGVLGKDRIFIVCDSNANIKVPSDFIQHNN
jgi:hypothetical protein